ncbi:MAG: hypothetical protein AAFQ04_07575 [Pseudomonadota bacterium]
MGWPFESETWEGVSGAIFMGQNMTGIYSGIGIAICIAFLVIGNNIEASKYKDHK